MKNPAAKVTIVDNDTSIFEGGDFDITSVYVTKEVGEKILNSKGKINLTVKTERISSGDSRDISFEVAKGVIFGFWHQK